MKKVMTLFFIALVGCNQAAKKQTKENEEMMVVAKDSSKSDLKKLSFAVKKDLICGMPVSAGIEDTVTYKDKLYGFCSKECKDEFIKDPLPYLANK